MNANLLLMLLLLVVMLAIGLGIAVLIIVLIARTIGGTKTSVPDYVPPNSNPRVATALASEQTRLLASLVVGIAVGLFVTYPLLNALGVGVDADSPYPMPDMIALLPWLGLGGGFAGLATYLLWRPAKPFEPNDVREADLTQRTPLGFGPRWAFTIPLVAAAIMILGLVAAGLASTQDANGDWRRISVDLVETWKIYDGVITQLFRGTHLISFPGWYYGVPLIIGVIVLVALTFWALHRTAGEPRIPGTTAELDTAVRTTKTKFLMASSSAALGVAIWLLASACANPLLSYTNEPLLALGDPDPYPDLPGYPPAQPWRTIGTGLNLVSGVAGIVTLWLLVVAIRAVIGIKRLR